MHILRVSSVFGCIPLRTFGILYSSSIIVHIIAASFEWGDWSILPVHTILCASFAIGILNNSCSIILIVVWYYLASCAFYFCKIILLPFILMGFWKPIYRLLNHLTGLDFTPIDFDSRITLALAICEEFGYFFGSFIMYILSYSLYKEIQDSQMQSKFSRVITAA